MKYKYLWMNNVYDNLNNNKYRKLQQQHHQSTETKFVLFSSSDQCFKSCMALK